MDYPMKDTYSEKEMFAYKQGRLYSQQAFAKAAIQSGNADLIKFVNQVLKVHGDINVEIH